MDNEIKLDKINQLKIKQRINKILYSAGFI